MRKKEREGEKSGKTKDVKNKTTIESEAKDKGETWKQFFFLHIVSLARRFFYTNVDTSTLSRL